MEFGLIGKVLGHSFSPMLHRLLWDADYGLLELTPEQAREYLQKREFRGINVTIPYKQLALECCDMVDEKAQKIGAVNTVVNQNGRLYGYNTDYDGLVYCFARAGLVLRGKKVLVFGSGGTAHTVRAVAADLGAAQIVTVSRTGENNYTNLHLHRDAQILINTTPLGMYPHAGALCADPADFPLCEGVMDAVYNPLITKFIYAARALHLPATCGLPMLAQQARLAARYFCGHEISPAKTEECLAAMEAQKRSVTLIGMPGCGKTSVGKELAALLNMEFADADEEIVRMAGKSIPEIFAQDGEDAFRQLETRALQNLCAQSGLVIATGGGAVLCPQNRYLLGQNGPVLYLQRPLAQLSTAGRPLSTDAAALRALYNRRRPLYEGLCQAAVPCGDSVHKAALLARQALQTVPSLI